MPPSGDPQAELDWSTAEIAIEKFRDYSMKFGHPDNRGKHLAFIALGWDVSTAEAREASARDVVSRLRSALPPAEVSEAGPRGAYGRSLRTGTRLVGPNGRAGTLVCVWLLGTDSPTPRLITNWLEVHKKVTP
jgi:uncharacterized protein DUF6883